MEADTNIIYGNASSMHYELNKKKPAVSPMSTPRPTGAAILELIIESLKRSLQPRILFQGHRLMCLLLINISTAKKAIFNPPPSSPGEVNRKQVMPFSSTLCDRWN